MKLTNLERRIEAIEADVEGLRVTDCPIYFLVGPESMALKTDEDGVIRSCTPEEIAAFNRGEDQFLGFIRVIFLPDTTAEEIVEKLIDQLKAICAEYCQHNPPIEMHPFVRVGGRIDSWRSYRQCNNEIIQVLMQMSILE